MSTNVLVKDEALSQLKLKISELERVCSQTTEDLVGFTKSKDYFGLCLISPKSAIGMTAALGKTAVSLRLRTNPLIEAQRKLQRTVEGFSQADENLVRDGKAKLAGVTLALVGGAALVATLGQNIIDSITGSVNRLNDQPNSWDDFDFDLKRNLGWFVEKVPTVLYDNVTQSLVQASEQFGFVTEARLSDESVADSVRRAESEQNYLSIIEPQYRDRFQKPNNITSMVYSMGLMSELGGMDESNIRILTKTAADGTNAYTVLLPSTKGWSPPNSWPQNFRAMNGQSDLMECAREALTKHMQADGLSPEQIKLAPVMVGGFSQGGLTAALMAQENHGQFNIEQVVSIGAPIGRLNIGPETNVLAYEFADDLVVSMDGKQNPTLPNWTTVKVPDGRQGIFEGYHSVVNGGDMSRENFDGTTSYHGELIRNSEAHDLGKYADAAGSTDYRPPLQDESRLSKFFSATQSQSDMTYKDFYASTQYNK